MSGICKTHMDNGPVAWDSECADCNTPGLPIPFKSDIATGPMRVPFREFPGDRITDGGAIAERIEAAEVAMREKCAKVADECVAEADCIMALFRDEESWQWALNEMTSDVNAHFGGFLLELRSVAVKIRSLK